MKKKSLSLMICAAVVMSQGLVSPFAVHAATSGSAYAMNEKLSSDVDIIVDGDFEGEDGTSVDGVKTYSTIKAAISSVPSKNAEDVVIYIKMVYIKKSLL